MSKIRHQTNITVDYDKKPVAKQCKYAFSHLVHANQVQTIRRQIRIIYVRPAGVRRIGYEIVLNYGLDGI